MSDQLKLKLIDSVEKIEDGVVKFGYTSKVVEIYINGREIVQMLKEIEKPYAIEEGHPEIAGGYGHNSPKFLYEDLLEALIEESYCSKYGVELLCCSTCGESGCWSILVFINQDDEYVYWNRFEHNHRVWKYNISFKFKKDEYEKAMQQLRLFAEV